MLKNSFNDKKKERISDYFACNTFSEEVMREKLSKSTHNSLLSCIEGDKTLTLEIANEVAHAMKEWAIEKGATHYAHWFQPLTGATAEKHDSFLERAGKAHIERFSGKQLVRQEPDASSFPSGGLRVTFEARGYTSWDLTSPAFIIEDGSGCTLCIPSVFVSYNGESLDQKAPLMRSVDALESSVKKMLIDIFDEPEQKVFSFVGAEQEYFLIDKQYALKRPDVLLSGRTVFGAKPPKGQEMDDQYFGTIKERVLVYMRDVEQELYKLGIPCKTRHNEVAPHQYEFAPIFEEANIAQDHNQLMMEIMKKKANENGFYLLLHEKPFDRINGSGKHINWSMNTEKYNLLEPGDEPENNVRFLTFLLSVIRGVHKYSGILRASVATASNDHRLGGNEAPPAIISVYLGSFLTALLKDIKDSNLEKTKNKKNSKTRFKDIGRLNLSETLSNIADNTDRNRTSPFAFTGNKFEFRAVGSSQSLAIPVTVINTIVAESLDHIYAKMKKAIKNAGNKDMSVLMGVIKEVIEEVSPVIFEGDNYSKEWKTEAKKRGLLNLESTPEALSFYNDKNTEKLFEKYNVVSKDGLHARGEVEFENYCKSINIEAKCQLDIARTMIFPAALEYQKLLLNNHFELKRQFNDKKIYNEIEKETKVLSITINEFMKDIDRLEKELEKTNKEKDNIKKANLFRKKILPLMQKLRDNGDFIETKVPNKYWELPKYHEMLFIE